MTEYPDSSQTWASFDPDQNNSYEITMNIGIKSEKSTK